MSDESPAPAAPTQLPTPTGWHVLCAVPQIDAKFSNSSIIKPDTLTRIEEHSTSVLFVLKVGPDAYKDTEKFPSGPWCKPGDFILVRTYSGTRFKVFDKEFRMISDDMVEGVIEDPRGYSRAA